MHIPQSTPIGTIVPLSGIDVSLHQFVGVSWHVLLPYSIFGAGLMTYSQYRLLRGQRSLKQQASQINKAPVNKTK